MSDSNRIRLPSQLIRDIEAQAGPRYMNVTTYITMVMGEHLAGLGRTGTPEPKPEAPLRDDGLTPEQREEKWAALARGESWSPAQAAPARPKDPEEPQSIIDAWADDDD